MSILWPVRTICSCTQELGSIVKQLSSFRVWLCPECNGSADVLAVAPTQLRRLPRVERALTVAFHPMLLLVLFVIVGSTHRTDGREAFKCQVKRRGHGAGRRRRPSALGHPPGPCSAAALRALRSTADPTRGRQTLATNAKHFVDGCENHGFDVVATRAPW